MEEEICHCLLGESNALKAGQAWLCVVLSKGIQVLRAYVQSAWSQHSPWGADGTCSLRRVLGTTVLLALQRLLETCVMTITASLPCPGQSIGVNLR